MSQRQTAVVQEFLASLRDFDWSELRNFSASGYWPFAVYMVTVAGGILLVLLIACLALAPGLSESWRSVQARSSVLADNHAALTSQLLARTVINTSMGRHAVPASLVQQQLLTTESMPRVLDQLRDLAVASGMSVSALRPQQKWQQRLQQAFEIELQAQADHHQLAALLGDIGALPLTLAIREVEWQQATSDARLTLFLLIAERGRAADTDTHGSADTVSGQAAETNTDDWRRVALIQRGNRYLEVLRDARGDTRRHDGEWTEDSQ